MDWTLGLELNGWKSGRNRKKIEVDLLKLFMVKRVCIVRKKDSKKTMVDKGKMVQPHLGWKMSTFLVMENGGPI
jgi:hypothetical protein